MKMSGSISSVETTAHDPGADVDHQGTAATVNINLPGVVTDDEDLADPHVPSRHDSVEVGQRASDLHQSPHADVVMVGQICASIPILQAYTFRESVIAG